MEAGPWSGLPVVDPSLWGHWEGDGGLGPGIAGPQLGCRTILNKDVEEVRTQGPEGGSWGLQAAPLPGFGADLWEGALGPGTLLLGSAYQGPWLTSCWGPCSFLVLP